MVERPIVDLTGEYNRRSSELLAEPFSEWSSPTYLKPGYAESEAELRGGGRLVLYAPRIMTDLVGDFEEDFYMENGWYEDVASTLRARQSLHHLFISEQDRSHTDGSLCIARNWKSIYSHPTRKEEQGVSEGFVEVGISDVIGPIDTVGLTPQGLFPIEVANGVRHRQKSQQLANYVGILRDICPGVPIYPFLAKLDKVTQSRLAITFHPVRGKHD